MYLAYSHAASSTFSSAAGRRNGAPGGPYQNSRLPNSGWLSLSSAGLPGGAKFSMMPTFPATRTRCMIGVRSDHDDDSSLARSEMMWQARDRWSPIAGIDMPAMEKSDCSADRGNTAETRGGV